MAKKYGMRRRSADEILKRAEKLEMLAVHPGNRDDPAWLRRRAELMRDYALRRSKHRQLKAEERRKNA
jgi:hypothetical protein